MTAAQVSDGPWCVRCGYCLHMLPESTVNCPECGSLVADSAIDVPASTLNRKLWKAFPLWLLLSIAVCIIAFFTILPCCVWSESGDSHCIMPKSFHGDPYGSTAYTEYYFVLPCESIVLGITGLKIFSTVHRVPLSIRLPSGFYSRMDVQPETLSYVYLNSKGSLQIGDRLNAEAITRWAADLGVDTKAKGFDIEAKFLLEFLQQRIRGKDFDTSTSPFERSWTHFSGHSDDPHATTITWISTAVVFVSTFLILLRRGRHRLIETHRIKLPPPAIVRSSHPNDRAG